MFKRLFYVAFCLVFFVACSQTENTAISEKDNTKLKKIVLTIDWVPSAEYFGIFYAKEKGFYIEEGFDVEISPSSGAPVVASQLAVGAISIGTTTSDNILRQIARGASFERAFPLLTFNPASIVSLSEKPIRTPKDLSGITLGVNKQSSVYQQLQYLIDSKVIEEKSWKEFPIGYGGPPQLLSNQVDAFCAYTTNQAVDLEIKDLNIQEMYFGNLGVATYGLVLLFADKKFLAKDGLSTEDVTKIAKATIKGYNEGAKDIMKAVEVLKKKVPTLDEKKLEVAIRKIGKLNRYTSFPPKKIDIWVNSADITEEVRKKTLSLYR